MNMVITLTPFIFVKCLCVDIVYTIAAVIFVPLTLIYNRIKDTRHDIRDILDFIYAYLMDMKGANIDGVRRLRVVS